MQRLNDDDGAIAVIVAVMFVVFLGMSVLVLDVGSLYWERRQLQNGADAAALAAAQDMVDGNGTAVAYESARVYADSNNRRGAFVGTPDFVVGSNSVAVTARSGNYTTASPPGAILAGVLGAVTPEVSATATASWGATSTGTTIPIAFCEHAWDNLTGADTSSGPPAHILRVGVPPGHLDSSVDCSNPGAGDPPPGGFGFLDADGQCLAQVDANDWMDGSNGNNPDIGGSRPCGTNTFYELLYDAVESGSSVLIPIFDYYENQGTHGRYHVVGFGGFVLEGYTVNGGPQHPVYGRSHNWSGSCPGSATCLRGYFAEFFDIGGVPAAGSGDYGAYVIGLTG